MLASSSLSTSAPLIVVTTLLLLLLLLFISAILLCIQLSQMKGFKNILFSLYAWCQCVCMSPTCVQEPHGGQKGMLDPFELELEAIVSFHVSTGNHT